VIHTINDVNYNKTHSQTHESLQEIYSLNIIEQYNDIYIEMTNWDRRGTSNDN